MIEMAKPRAHLAPSSGTNQVELNAMVETLDSGAAQLGINLPNDTGQKLVSYLQLLKKWNQRHNLTAIGSLSKMVTHHLLDCLAISPYLRGVYICDVGSGAGLPGIPLALARPDLQMTLLDSRAKRVSFLRYVASTLKIKNISIEQMRAEEYKPTTLFDTVTARAVAPLGRLIPLCRPLVKRGGRIIAMKSSRLEQEFAQLNSGNRASCRLKELNVPGVNARRCVVVMEC